MADSPLQRLPKGSELGRRQFIRTAAATGALVWTVPTIISIEPAGASVNRHSAPPKPPVQAVHQSPTPAPPPSPSPGVDATQLPFTGDNQNLELGVAAAAIVGGAALIIAAAEPERRPTE